MEGYARTSLEPERLVGLTQASLVLEVEQGAQVAVGHHNIQIMVTPGPDGGLVNIGGDRPFVVPRDPGDHRPPTRPRLFVDRRDELARLLEETSAGGAVEVWGAAGIGKTTLLRRAAHAATGQDRLPLLHTSARGLAVDDVLQSLFDLLFLCAQPFKPVGRAALSGHLRQAKAVLLLDDLALDADDVGILEDAAPGCCLVVSGTERRLWDISAIELRGLPLDDAVDLVGKVLGRPLDEGEREAVGRLWSSFAGEPLRLLRVARLAREGVQTLAEAAAVPDPIWSQRSSRSRRATGGSSASSPWCRACCSTPTSPPL